MVDMHPKMVEGAFLVDNYLREILGYEPVITSANDGRHRHASAHYRGCALDYRTWTTATSGHQLPPAKRHELVHGMRQILGQNFDVIGEDDHIHCEYDPKRPT
jgi:hypothetical protein